MGQKPKNADSPDADENLKAYVELAWQVWEPIKNDPEAYEKFLRLLEERRKEKEHKR